MLILTRRVGQTLVIDEGGITVTVLSLSGNQIRLGVIAPKTTSVDREEVWLRKQAERGQSVQPKAIAAQA